MLPSSSLKYDEIVTGGLDDRYILWMMSIKYLCNNLIEAWYASTSIVKTKYLVITTIKFRSLLIVKLTMTKTALSSMTSIMSCWQHWCKPGVRNWHSVCAVCWHDCCHGKWQPSNGRSTWRLSERCLSSGDRWSLCEFLLFLGDQQFLLSVSSQLICSPTSLEPSSYCWHSDISETNDIPISSLIWNLSLPVTQRAIGVAASRGIWLTAALALSVTWFWASSSLWSLKTKVNMCA